MAATTSIWSPSSWRERRALHQPGWPDEERAADVRQRLAKMPPLVFAGEARALRAALARVGEGRAFVLQAGDCAESFHDFSAITIREKLKIMLQMSAVLTYGGGVPHGKGGPPPGPVAEGPPPPAATAAGPELAPVPRPTINRAGAPA